MQSSKQKKLFVVAGEISGDSHGFALIDALPRAQFQLSGLGGPQMHGHSPDIEDWLEQAAVLGLVEVLKNYSYFKSKMVEAAERIETTKPDGVIFIDYPGFNLRLAKRLRDAGYKGKLIYYISPQVWAWKKGRIRTMAKLLDVMICIFPFEKPLYENSGLETIFCGHPLVDSLADIKADTIERELDLVALLPGSREREIEALFQPMLEAAKQLKKRHPHVRFATTGATDTLSEKLSHIVKQSDLVDPSDIEILTGAGQQIMRRAHIGVVASGTATLEAAILGLPYCLVYKVNPITAWVARRLLKISYLGIVNVIANREVVCELLQEKATGDSIAHELDQLLTDAESREDLLVELAEVTASLGGGGAHEQAAKAVIETLG